MSVDTEVTVAIHVFGSTGVSSAGANPVKGSLVVLGKLSALAYYSCLYTVVNHSILDPELLPPRSAASGGYLYTAVANSHMDHKTTGKMCDDVVGEVSDKVGCITGSEHLGGTSTDKTSLCGNVNVPLPLYLKTVDVFHDPLPSGSKILATNIAYNLV